MPFGENTIGTLYATIDGKMVELGEATLTEVETYLEESKYEWVKVVRCRDCKYYQDNNDGYPHPDCKWNENETPDEEDFCSGAERNGE